MVVSIGELVLDVTIAPEAGLRLNDDSRASIQLRGGGQAANFCAWSAALGERARLVTRVGDDEIGRRLVAEIEAGGVEVVAVVGAEPTGAIAVLVGENGQRTMATQRGAVTGLRPEDLDPRWFAGARLLHLPAYSLFTEPLAGASLQAAQAAREHGALLAVDLSSEAGLREYGGERMATLLGHLRPELLFATEPEAAALGVPLEQVAKLPVLKLGAQGCRVFGRRVPAPVVDAIDATGAGDAFAAGFCAAYLEGATPLESAGRAVLVASRSVTTMGARP
jgi:sugar/nucleoside kinase (ribokinase family)